jgi:hypothetical protein
MFAKICHVCRTVKAGVIPALMCHVPFCVFILSGLLSQSLGLRTPDLDALLEESATLEEEKSPILQIHFTKVKLQTTLRNLGKSGVGLSGSVSGLPDVFFKPNFQFWNILEVV